MNRPGVSTLSQSSCDSRDTPGFFVSLCNKENSHASRAERCLARNERTRSEILDRTGAVLRAENSYRRSDALPGQFRQYDAAGEMPQGRPEGPPLSVESL